MEERLIIIGMFPFKPIGSTEEDRLRYINLCNAIDFIERVINEIDIVRSHKDRKEYSIREAGLNANEFFERLKYNLCNEST